MKKNPRVRRTSGGMGSEYDFTGAVRAKYATRSRHGSNVVVLDPDVAKAFTDSRAVNRALRAILDALPSRPRRRARSA